MEAAIDKLERQKENVQQKMQQMEKDLQFTIQQEKHTHEEDVERLTRERVGIDNDFSLFFGFFFTGCL